MINVAAIRMQQFGVQFYQASLTASDIDKLVRFEVLSYGENAQPPVRGGRQRVDATPSKVNWDLLERRIASNEKAYQRQIIRRKIDELVQYYEQCRQARILTSILRKRTVAMCFCWHRVSTVPLCCRRKIAIRVTGSGFRPAPRTAFQAKDSVSRRARRECSRCRGVPLTAALIHSN